MSARIEERLSYSVRELAALTGLSQDQIRTHIDRGDLTAKYSGTKKVILAEEARRFVQELPEENLGPLK